MATKLGKKVTYLDGLQTITLHVVMWQPKIIISPLPQYLWPPNLAASWWLAMRGFHLYCYSTLWSRGCARSRDKLIHYISNTTISMATKLGRMVTYFDYLLLIKSNDHIITRFCETTWQTKNMVSPIPQCLWQQNMARWWLTSSDFYPQSHMTIPSRGVVKSRDKLK